MTTVSPPRTAMTPVAHRVVAVRRDVDDTMTLALAPAGDDALPTPAPGQFTMVWVPGVGEIPLSVSGIDGDSLEHTVRNVGAVTGALCGSGVGALVGLRGPFGRPWPVPPAGDVLVVAGGLGLAPLRLFVQQLAAGRAREGRVVLVYGSRSPDQLLYPGEYDAWREAGIEVVVTVDHADRGWSGRVGVVTTIFDEVRPDAATTAYVCGPEVMMRVVAADLVGRGLAPAAVHLSLERNMHCGVGHCGHCQLGSLFVCHDGPVVTWAEAAAALEVRQR